MQPNFVPMFIGSSGSFRFRIRFPGHLSAAQQLERSGLPAAASITAFTIWSMSRTRRDDREAAVKPL